MYDLRDNATYERRFAVDEVRAEGGDATEIVGHAAIFNHVTDLYWFREQIAPGAFAASLGNDDVRALFNHDPNLILGRNRAGNLKLSEDDRGLLYRVTPDKRITYVADLMVSLERGDVSQSSFGFEAIREEWDFTDPDMPTRTLLEAKLWDVSPVTFPAYPETDAATRSAKKWCRDHGIPEKSIPAFDIAALAARQRRLRLQEAA